MKNKIAKIKADYDLNRLVSEWGFYEVHFIDEYYSNDFFVVNTRTKECYLKCQGADYTQLPQIIIDMALAGVFEKGEK